LIVLLNLKPIHALGTNVETKYIDINTELYEFIDTSKDCYLIEDYGLNQSSYLDGPVLLNGQKNCQILIVGSKI